MNKLDFLNKLDWDLDRYKPQFNPNYWDLCCRFITAHKTKYPEKRVMELTHAFYQMLTKRKKYDFKTTRMVSALAAELLENGNHNVKKRGKAEVICIEDDLQTKKTNLLLRENDPYKKRKEYMKDEQKNCAITGGGNCRVFCSEDNSQTNKAKFTWKLGDSDQERNGSTVQNKCILSGSDMLTQNHDKSNNSGIMTMKDTKDEQRKDIRTTNLRKSETEVTIELSCSNTYHQKESLLCENPSHTNIAVAVLRLKELKELLEGFVIFRGVNEFTKLNDSVKTLEESFRYSKFGPCEWEYNELDKDCRLIWVALRWKNTILAEAVGTVKDELCSRIAKVILSKIAEFAFFVEARCSYYNHGSCMDSQMKHMNNVVVSEFSLMRDEMDKFAVKHIFQFRELVLHNLSAEQEKQLISYAASKWSQALRYRKAFKDDGDSVLCFYHVLQGELLKQKLLENHINSYVREKYKLHLPGQHEIVSLTNENVKEKAELYFDITKPHKKNATYETNMVDNIDLIKLLPGFILFYDANKNSQIEDNSFTALIDSFKRYKFGPLEVVNENSGHWSKRCQLKCRGKILAEGEDLVDAQAQANATLNLLTRLKAFSFTIQANQEYFCNGKVPHFLENSGLKKNNEFRIIKHSELSMIPAIAKEFCEKPTFQELIFGADVPWEIKMQISRYMSYRGLIHRLFTSSDDSVDPTHMAIFHPINLNELKAYLLHNQGENMKYRLKPPGKFPSVLPIPEICSDMKNPPAEVTPTLSTSDRSTDNKRKLEEGSVGEVKVVKKLKAAPPDFITDVKLPGFVLFIGVKKNSKIQNNLMQILHESFAMSKYGSLHMNLIDEDMGGNVSSRCVLKVETMVLAEVTRENKVLAKLDASRLLFDHLRKFCFTIQAKQSYYRSGNGLPKCSTRQYTFKEKKTLSEIINESQSSKVMDAGIEIVYRRSLNDRQRKVIIAEIDKLNLGYRSVKLNHISAIAVYRLPSPTMLKYELEKTNRENEKYQLIQPGGKITFPGGVFFPADKSMSNAMSSIKETNLPLNVNPVKSKEENTIEAIREPDRTSQVPPFTTEETQDSDQTTNADFFWTPKEFLPKVAKSLFMCKLVRSDSTTESDPCVLLDSTISLISNVVFKYITSVTNDNQYQVIVGLELDNRHLKLGKGVARNVQNAKLIAAHKSIDMLQMHCKVIVPNFHYFGEGGIPQFIHNRFPRITTIYEIASKGEDQSTIYSMLQQFMNNTIQDLFFLSSEFSNRERNEIVRYSSANKLGWRVFGPAGAKLWPEDLVTTQNVCVFKKKTLLTLIKELIVKGGVTEQYHYYTGKAGESKRNTTETIMKHEEVLKRSQSCLDDCPDYYYSSCAKNNLCQLRHEPNAKGSTTVCFQWEKSTCFDLHCKHRHMKLGDSSASVSSFTRNCNPAIQPVSILPPVPVVSHPTMLDQCPTLQPYSTIQPPGVPYPTGSLHIPIPPPTIQANIPDSLTQLNLPSQRVSYQHPTLPNVRGNFPFKLPMPKQDATKSDPSFDSHPVESATGSVACVLENQPGGCCKRDCGFSHSNILDIIVNEVLGVTLNSDL